MRADEINTLAVLIAKNINHKLSSREKDELCALLNLILCNLGTYNRFCH